MNFLVDAQLPRRLAWTLTAAGHDVVHTLDLPNGNRTTDGEINARSILEKRVVINKDSDFVDSYLVSREPYKLLHVSTGNISNTELEAIVMQLLPSIVAAFQSHDYAELSRTALIVHA